MTVVKLPVSSGLLTSPDGDRNRTGMSQMGKEVKRVVEQNTEDHCAGRQECLEISGRIYPVSHSNAKIAPKMPGRMVWYRDEQLTVIGDEQCENPPPGPEMRVK